MPNFANIVLTGHIGKDPELTYLPDGTPVLRFSLAVNTGVRDRKVCSWYRCVMFGRQGESISQYLAKGKAVTISGEPTINNFTSDQGIKYTNVDVRVNSFAFAGSGEGHAQPSGGTQEAGAEQAPAFDPENDTVPF